MTPDALAAAVLAVVGVATLAAALYALTRRRAERRYGSLVAVGEGPQRSPPLVSERWRLSGAPDELRQMPDGSIVPVEWKLRSAPPGGPYPSHRVQVWAYCLLVEETWGRPPRFGVVRYGDGTEFRVPWDRRAREDLVALRRAIARPYRGEATPSVGRCQGCAYRASCDARAA